MITIIACIVSIWLGYIAVSTWNHDWFEDECEHEWSHWRPRVIKGISDYCDLTRTCENCGEQEDKFM